jgi:hypothetical protein
MTQKIILLIAFFMANLPWVSHKLFYLIPINSGKHLAWALFELLILYFIVGMLAVYAELSSFGQVFHQGWEFYAVTFCLFLVFSFPGFVYRYLYK